MKLLLLDLDGTVRRITKGGRPEDQELIPEAVSALSLYSSWHWVGITNQGGVPEEKSMEEAIKQQEITLSLLPGLDSIMMAPGDGSTMHHIQRVRKGANEYLADISSSAPGYYRKPNPGMIEQAITLVAYYSSTLDGVMMIGDRDEDRRAAENYGIYFQSAKDFHARECRDHEYRLAVRTPLSYNPSWKPDAAPQRPFTLMLLDLDAVDPYHESLAKYKDQPYALIAYCDLKPFLDDGKYYQDMFSKIFLNTPIQAIYRLSPSGYHYVFYSKELEGNSCISSYPSNLSPLYPGLRCSRHDALRGALITYCREHLGTTPTTICKVGGDIPAIPTITYISPEMFYRFVP